MPFRHALIGCFSLLCVLAFVAPVQAQKEKKPGEEGRAEKSDVIQDQLDRTLPELTFEEVSFADTVDFLRDVSSIRIDVKWKVLEEAGVDREAPVSVKLKDVTMGEAINQVLKAAGGDVKLGYATKKDKVVISTADDLKKAKGRKKKTGEKLDEGWREKNSDVQTRLDQRVPDISFADASFSPTLEFLSDVSGIEFVVKWEVLEKAGVDKEALVPSRLRHKTVGRALTEILDAAGGDVKLGYAAKKDRVVISTAEDLAKEKASKKSGGKKPAGKK